MGVQETIAKTYDGSMHTILTSPLIMLLVMGALYSVFENPTIVEICLTIAKDALCTILLIIFILP